MIVLLKKTGCICYTLLKFMSCINIRKNKYKTGKGLLLCLTFLLCAVFVCSGCQSPDNNKTSMLSRASIMMDKQKLPQAELILRKILSQDPFDIDASALYSKLLLLRGQSRAAAKELKSVHAKYPDNNEIGILLGQALINENLTGSAEVAFRNILINKPDSVQAKLGLAKISLLHYEQDEFQWAASRYPLETINLLYIYGNRELAIKECEKLITPEIGIGPQAQASLFLFHAYTEKNRPDLAIKYLEIGAKAFPERIGKQELVDAIKSAKELNDRKKEHFFLNLLKKMDRQK